MLQVLRDSMKYLAWVLWAVIAVFILFVFVDFGGYMPSGQPNRAAASVGEQDVTYRELEREYRNLDDSLRQRLGDQYTPELAEQLRLPLQALNQVIDRKVLLAEARSLGLVVGDQEVRDYILELPVFTEAGRFVGAETYDRIVRRLGHTPESFEASIREQMLVERFVGALESSFTVSQSEVEDRYRRQAERARVRYVQLPHQQVRADAQPTQAELQARFDADPEAYRVPEQRTADYLLVDPRRLQGDLEIPADEIATFFSEHQSEYYQQEQVRARHILVGVDENRSREAAQARFAEARARIEAGEEFATVAREYSDDPGSASRGGDLGYFGRGRMVPPFEEAAFGGAVGELIGPVVSQFGVHLILVEDRREERQRTLEEVEGQIKNRLAAERAASEAETLALTLRDRAAAESTLTFEGLAAEADAVEAGTTRPFSAEGAILPIGNAPALNPQLFALQVGELAEPAQTPRGWVVLRLTEVIPSHVPELAEVRGQVQRDLVAEKSAELAEAQLRTAAAQAEGSLDALATALGLGVEQSPEFGPGDSVPGLGPNRALVDAVFAAPDGVLSAPVRHNNASIVFEVVERQRFSAEAFATQEAQLREQMTREQMATVLSSLVSRRKQELGVHYDRQLLESWDLLGQLGSEQG